MKGDKTIPLCWATVAGLALWLVILAGLVPAIEFALAHFHIPRV